MAYAITFELPHTYYTNHLRILSKNDENMNVAELKEGEIYSKIDECLKSSGFLPLQYNLYRSNKDIGTVLDAVEKLSNNIDNLTSHIHHINGFWMEGWSDLTKRL